MKRKTPKIVTLADARDARVRDEARAIARDRAATLADAERRAARAAARYAEFGGSLHRLARWRTARRVRDLKAARP